MKPSFALNLSHEGISLLHRTPGGWHLVGEARLDDKNLPETLRFLRKTAVELDARAVTTKLIIPASQILYVTIDAPAEGPDDIDAFIRNALDGRTPYGVDDLVFDWQRRGGELLIAAVARETLDEAESFAAEHKFNPVSFAAIPDGEAFDGEPFFGVTSNAQSLLEPGDEIERDAFATKVVPLPEISTPATPDHGARTVPATDEGEDEGDAADKADEAATDAAPSVPDQAEDQKAEDGEARDSEADGEESTDAATDDAETADETADEEAEAEIASNTADDDADDGAPVPLPSFSSRRDASATEGANTETTLPPARLVVLPSGKDGSAPQIGSVTKNPGVTAPMAPDLPAPVLLSGAVPADDIADPDPAPTPPPVAQDVPRTEPPAAPPPVTPAAANAGDAAPDVGENLTVFGARKATAQRGKPAYLGLMLTVALLAALALVAVWSSLFLEGGVTGLFRSPDQQDTPTITATAPDGTPPVSPAPIVTELPAPNLPEAPAPIPLAPPPTQEEAEAIHAATGAWPLAPQPPNPLREGSLDDLYIASLDPEIASLDAVALPAVDTSPGLARLPDQHSPAPEGTAFALDDRGFVIPTEDGALNADGVIVFAGRPPGATPVRPRNAAVADSSVSNTDLAVLAAFRPAVRPSDLLERHERGQLGGLTRAELAALRPAPRPEAPQLAEDVDQTPTEFAIAQSRVPAARPDGFAEIVTAARANPENETASGSSGGTTTTASGAVGSAPAIPTRASVARQATVANAINLRRLSLIGVYGTSSDRRALVRLRTGRYVKVEVGDRVDGGRVAAIGGSSLQYVKGGRNVTLSMPDT